MLAEEIAWRNNNVLDCQYPAIYDIRQDSWGYPFCSSTVYNTDMDAPPVQKAFELYAARNFEEAEEICKTILAAYPENADMLYLSGLLSYQRKDYQSAIDFYTRALSIQNSYVSACHDLGVLLQEIGQYESAIACYQKTLQLNPSLSTVHYNLGIIFHERHEYDRAIMSYKNALEINPYYPDARFNLGMTYQEVGKYDDALQCFQKMLLHNMASADVYYRIGKILEKQGRIFEAMTYYKKVTAIARRHDVRSDVDCMHVERVLDQAIVSYQKALQVSPDNHDVYNKLGLAFQERGRWNEAKDCFQRALELSPHFPEAEWNLSLVHLLTGNFQEGLRGFELRSGIKGFSYDLDFAKPLWNGEQNLAGKILLLVSEYGLGDTIQFVRYAPLLAERGAEVILVCQRELVPLLKDMQGIQRVIPTGSPLPDFDMYCPLLSLPFFMQTTLESIPSNVPYLTADQHLTELWRDGMQSEPSELRVGLAWAGGFPEKKSCPLQLFSPLGRISRCVFYSLQKGEASVQAKNPPEGMRLLDYTDEIRDFSDTAAFIQNLDLVISVDTAVVHLAGAMGKPVWTLLPFAPDWRWMLDRSDSPWYPSMRLFRQPSPGDWRAVIHQVKEAVEGYRGGLRKKAFPGGS